MQGPVSSAPGPDPTEAVIDPLEANPLKNVNVAHPAQDVHGARKARPGLFRFKVAGALVPPAAEMARALDVGGGMAEFAEVLRSKGYATDLADLSEQNVANARAAGFGAHRIDLNEGLPGLDDATYDVVGMLEVIEHVVTSEHLLAEGRRVLKPGGLLVLSTPNVAFVKDRVAGVAGRPPVAEGYHYRFFTIATMRRLFRRTDLEIVAERFSSPAIGANVIRRTLMGKKDRKHVLVPRSLAPAFAQTMYFLGRRPR